MTTALIALLVFLVLVLLYFAFNGSNTATTATTPTPSPKLSADGSACTSGSSCSGGYCVYGKCTSVVSGSPSCSPTVACPTPATQYCDNNVCVTMPSNSDCTPGCAPGYICENKVCTGTQFYQTACDDACTSGVCNALGICVSSGALYKCATNSDCVAKTGPDSVCTSAGYCSCAWDLPTPSGYACFGGTPINVGASSAAAGTVYPSTNTMDVLRGYVSDGYNYKCGGAGGQYCSVYQTCVNGKCT